MKDTTHIPRGHQLIFASWRRRVLHWIFTLMFAATPVLAQGPAPMESLTFEQVAKLRRTHAMIFEPVHLVDEKSKIVLHLLTSGTPGRAAGGEHGARVVCFAIKPDGSGYVTIFNEPVPTSGVGGGMGAGKVSMHDIFFNDVPLGLVAADGSAHVIVAVVGYNIARTGAAETPAMLPRELFVSARVPTQGILIGMLLPAVQKVR